MLITLEEQRGRMTMSSLELSCKAMFSVKLAAMMTPTVMYSAEQKVRRTSSLKPGGRVIVTLKSEGRGMTIFLKQGSKAMELALKAGGGAKM